MEHEALVTGDHPSLHKGRSAGQEVRCSISGKTDPDELRAQAEGLISKSRTDPDDIVARPPHLSSEEKVLDLETLDRRRGSGGGQQESGTIAHLRCSPPELVLLPYSLVPHTPQTLNP